MATFILMNCQTNVSTITLGKEIKPNIIDFPFTLPKLEHSFCCLTMWLMEAEIIAAQLYLIGHLVPVVYVFTNRNQLQPLPLLPRHILVKMGPTVVTRCKASVGTVSAARSNQTHKVEHGNVPVLRLTNVFPIAKQQIIHVD